MFRAFVFLLLATGLSSCSVYQYNSVSSTLPKDTQQGFTYENDSLRAIYRFDGRNGPVTIQVHNKLTQPLYVNWQRSSLIIGHESHPYWRDVADVNLQTRSTQVQWTRNVSTANAQTTGTISKDESISFIPPLSYITVSYVTLQNQFFTPADPGANFAFYTRDGKMTGTKHSYDSLHSPLAFNTFLTFSTDQNFEHVRYVKNRFWVSDVVKTMADPRTIYPSVDQFYIHKATGVGKTAVVLIYLGLIVLGATAKTHH